MKIAPTKYNPMEKKNPLLPLVPDKEPSMTKSNSISFDLKVNPADADSSTYRSNARILDGTESIRAILKWSVDLEPAIVTTWLELPRP